MTKVLVLEEEIHLRAFYQYLLGDKCNLEFAEPDHDGFHLAIAGNYDMVISDLEMVDH